MDSWQVDNEIIFDRDNLNPIKQWWINIDKVNFLLIIGMIVFGVIMASTSSPAIAQKISTNKLFFIHKQIIFAFVAIFTIIFISFFDKQQVKITSIFGFLLCILLLILVLMFGSEAKGAKRWIMLFGFNLQPSEFIKVFFLVFNALLLQKLREYKWLIKYGVSALCYFIIASLLILQPDFGMTIIVTALWIIQLFAFGLPLILIIAISCFGILGGVFAYLSLPHVADRINKFLNLNQQNYQVTRSIDAYINGGFFGVSPGNGTVKEYIPDAHTDFVFAVVAEEFGLITCLFLMTIFLVIISRVMKRVIAEEDLFSKLAVIGLISQIALQSLINIGVSIGMLPTKGMTLPFISYGGSSIVAISIGFGMILSLTKKKYDDKINYENLMIN